MNYVHKSSYHIEILTQLQDPNLKQERKYILKMLFYAINGLYSRGIYVFPNIIEIFKINGYKKSNFFFDAISDIIENINIKLKGNIGWIKRRTLKKANMKEKNIIICFLLFIYHEYFVQYLYEYLLRNEPNKEKIRNIISKLQNIVRPASNIYPLINFNKNVSGNEKNLKDQKQNPKNFDNNFNNNDIIDYEQKLFNDYSDLENYSGPDFDLDNNLEYDFDY